jgi:hypothetical protein
LLYPWQPPIKCFEILQIAYLLLITSYLLIVIPALRLKKIDNIGFSEDT